MGKAKEEFMKRLRQGIPTGEVGPLVEAVEAERAREDFPKTNPVRVKDPRAQRLYNIWFSQCSTATVEQKDKVGLAYIIQYLGFDEQTAQAFTSGDGSARHAIGMKQSNLPYTNLAEFWNRIREIFPNTYTDEDIAFLTEGGPAAICTFLNSIEIAMAWDSEVLKALAINAHAYK